MPRIIVQAEGGRDDGVMTWRERVTVADFQGAQFGRQLIERLAWAVEDAVEAEGQIPPREPFTGFDRG